MSKRSYYGQLLLVLFLLLVTFSASLYQLPEKSLFSDEAITIDVARKGMAEILSVTTSIEPQPPLYYFLFSFWLRLAGESEFSARYFSVLGAVAAVAIIFALARALGGRRAGLLAVCMVALNPYLIYYAQYVRIYTLAPAIAGATALCFLLALRKSTRRRWAIVAVLTIVGGYISYFNLLPSAFLGLLSLLMWLRSPQGLIRETWRRAFLAHLMAGLTMLLWLPVVWHYLTSLAPGVPRWRVFVGPIEMIWRTILAFGLGHAIDLSGTPWIVLSAIALGLLWIIGVRRPLPIGEALSSRSASFVLIGYMAFPLLVILIVSLVEPLYHDRYVAIMFPVFAATAALAVVGKDNGEGGTTGVLKGFKGRAWLGLTGALFVILVLGELVGLKGWYFDRRFTKDDFRSMVAHMEPRLRPGDVILVSAGYVRPAIEYYLRSTPAWRGPLTRLPASLDGLSLVQVGQIDAEPDETKARILPDDYYSWVSIGQAALDLRRLAMASQRIWFVRVYDTVNDPQSLVLPWLRTNLFALEERVFDGTSYPQLYLFSTRRPPSPVLPPIQNRYYAKLGESVELLGYDLSPRQAQPGNLLRLRLYWRAAGLMKAEYKVFVHLLDQKLNRLTGVDRQPLMNRRPTSDWQPGEVLVDDYDLEVPTETPPGLYSIGVGMYDPKTGQRLGNGDLNIDRVVVRRPLGLPSDAQRIAKRLGDIELVARSGLQEANVGHSLRLKLYWRALSKQSLPYTVFLHVVDASGALVAQDDGPPASGDFPTSAWPEGDLVEDIRGVPSGVLRPGNYSLLVGLYNSATGQRLKSPDGADYISLGTIRLDPG